MDILPNLFYILDKFPFPLYKRNCPQEVRFFHLPFWGQFIQRLFFISITLLFQYNVIYDMLKLLF